MGGTGPGHKSWRARESRRVNIQKARAARKRAPLPWRSGMESRIIEQLVWQWFLEARGWRQEAGKSRGKGEMQIPRRYAPRNDNVYGGAGRPWAKLRMARFLGVSHTWVNKLVKKFEADPERMRRKLAAFAPASIEKLERAREETRWEREHGRLREPIRYRRVKVVLYGKKRKVMVPTRRTTAASDKRRGIGESPRSKIEHGAPEKATPVAYREIPSWAKGLLLPGDPGTFSGQATGRGSGGRTPRPVPFAFRRRR